MAVTAGTVTTAALNAGSSLTFGCVSTSNPLYVLVGCWMSTTTLSSVTFKGTALTRVAQSALSNANDRAEIWRLLTPTATTANIVMTFSGAGPAGTIGALNVSGQDGTTPEGTAATNASSVAGTSTGNVTVNPATGDLTLVVVADGGGVAITPASSGGGAPVELYDAVSNGEESEAFKVADAATVVSATFTSQTWAIAALPLKAPSTPFIFQRGPLWPHRAM